MSGSRHVLEGTYLQQLSNKENFVYLPIIMLDKRIVSISGATPCRTSTAAQKVADKAANRLWKHITRSEG